jgi:hypothetical protein
MKWPAVVATPARPPAKPLAIRLMWMALFWAAGVACVLGVALILRGVLFW